MTTITIDNQNEIKEILSLMTVKPNSLPLVKPKAIKVSSNDELREITNFLYESANTLPQDWKIMPSEHKQVLIDLAYKWTEDDGETSFFDVLLLPFRIVVFLIKYRNDTVQAFKDARDGFIDAIFNEVEKDNIHYQQELNKAVDEINTNIIGNPINQEDVHEWLNSLLD